MSAMNLVSQSGQTMVILPASAIDELASSINEMKDLLLGRAKVEAGEVWVESSEARKMLGISQRTWQSYRDRKVIPFSQFGRKIYVRKADIDTFLSNHSINNNL